MFIMVCTSVGVRVCVHVPLNSEFQGWGVLSSTEWKPYTWPDLIVSVLILAALSSSITAKTGV